VVNLEDLHVARKGGLPQGGRSPRQ
jgi:hypothetical protein